MAIRATITAVTAIVAAVAVESTALPKLQTELKNLPGGPPPASSWVDAFQGRLRYVPIPALLLGIAAIAVRGVRPVLAPLAMIAGILAMIAIVGTVAAALAPLYQAPRDMGLE